MGQTNTTTATLSLLLALVCFQAQAQPVAQAVPNSPYAQDPPQTGTAGDTIEVRAQRARELEQAKAAQAAVGPAGPGSAGNPVANSVTQVRIVKPVVPRAEFYVEAIRGFEGRLEAALVINGKRATGSVLYPTLADGWNISSVTDNGVTIHKGKERQQLAFVGPEPYQVTTNNAINVVPAVLPNLMQGGQGVMPVGTPLK